MVENFAVLHHSNQAIVADKGLVTAAQIDDGQAPITNGHTAVGLMMDAPVIRPAMQQSLRHAVKHFIVQRLLFAIPVAEDATHDSVRSLSAQTPQRPPADFQIQPQRSFTRIAKVGFQSLDSGRIGSVQSLS